MSIPISGRDKTFGNSGQWIWLVVGSVTFLPAVFLLIALGSIGHRGAWSNIAIAAIFFLLPSFWGGFYIVQVINVFQQITVDESNISGKLYFARRRGFSFSEVSRISYYPLTWKVRKINLFDPKNPGIDIRTLHGHQYRINARTDGFREIVVALKAAARNYREIECEL